MKNQNPDKQSRQAKTKSRTKEILKKASIKRWSKLRQEKSQHVLRPENFDVAGCGIEIYFDHLTFIPDFDDPKLTVEYMDKERVCKKCRKRYKLDEAVSKGRRK